jgi:hypothetical protein
LLARLVEALSIDNVLSLKIERKERVVVNLAQQHYFEKLEVILFFIYVKKKSSKY